MRGGGVTSAPHPYQNATGALPAAMEKGSGLEHQTGSRG